MDLAHQHKLMLKILIGSAWIDRHLESEEVNYLSKVLTRFNLDHDSELQALLKMAVPVEQTERWLVAYLKDTPETERLKLLAAVGNLLISDQEVSDVEHDLLDEFHELMASIPAPPESSVSPSTNAAPRLLKQIGQFFRRITSQG
jgi:hypothetical protein